MKWWIEIFAHLIVVVYLKGLWVTLYIYNNWQFSILIFSFSVNFHFCFFLNQLSSAAFWWWAELSEMACRRSPSSHSMHHFHPRCIVLSLLCEWPPSSSSIFVRLSWPSWMTAPSDFPRSLARFDSVAWSRFNWVDPSTPPGTFVFPVLPRCSCCQPGRSRRT